MSLTRVGKLFASSNATFGKLRLKSRKHVTKHWLGQNLSALSAVWEPHHQIHIQSLEKIQKAAARYVTGNYQMETGNSQKNLESLGWETLEERRLRTKLTLFHKGKLGAFDIPTDHLILKTRQTRRGGGGQVDLYTKENSRALMATSTPSTLA